MKSSKQVLINILSACLTIFPIYSFDGNQLGLMDSNGKVIVPAEYSEIRYLDKSLYLMRTVDLGLEVGKRVFLFDHDGKDVMVNVPEGSEFAGIYHLPADANSATICKTHSLPKGTLQIFRRHEKFGLCTENGEVLLPAQYGAIDNINGGLSLIFQNAVRSTYPDRELYVTADKLAQQDGGVYTFDILSKKLIPLALPKIYSIAPEYSDGLRTFTSLSEKWMHECKGQDGKIYSYQVLHGFLDAQGKIAINPQFNRTEDFKNGRAVVKVYPGPNASGGDFFVINKQGKRISPPGMQVVSSIQNAFRTRAGAVNSDGLVNINFETLLPNEYSSVRLRKDGTFLASKSTDQIAYALLNNNVTLQPVPLENPGECIYLKCVSKSLSKSDAIYGARTYENVRIQDVAFSQSWDNAAKGLTLDPVQILFAEDDDDGSHCFSTSQVVKFFPNIPKVNCEPDRIIMRKVRGSYGFDSEVWKEQQARMRGVSRTPSRDPNRAHRLSYVTINSVDMFSRFLHEFDLIGMSRERVLSLLGAESKITIAGGGCLGDTLVVQLTYDGDKVKSWKFNDGKEVTENVVLIPTMCSK